MSTAAKGQSSGGYEVGRPQGKCSLCGRGIEIDERYFAALRETLTGLERLDIGKECWEGFDRKDVLGFWQTTMPRAEQKKKLFVDDEVLANLFERLADATEPGKINFRFVLGLILIRKRMLVYEQSRKEGEKEIWVVRFRGKEERLDLLDPKLNEQQVLEVSQQLGEILNEEL